MIQNVLDLEILAGKDEYGQYSYEVWFDDQKITNLEEFDVEEGWIRIRIGNLYKPAFYKISSKKWGRVTLVKVYK